MAYTKTTWVNGTSPNLNATNLNHIETGIYDAHQLGGGTEINVTAYGATGNGSTDDSTAIRSALAAATVGDVVLFPKGTYLVSQDGANAWCLRLNTAGVTVTGSGIVKMAASQAAAVSVFAVSADDVIVEGITINGNGTNNTVNEHRHGIMCSGDRFVARNVRITDCTGDGIMFFECADGRALGCWIDTCDRNGVTLYSASATPVSGIEVADCIISAAVQAIDSEPESVGVVKNVRIVGNYLVGGPSVASNDGWSISMSGTSTSYPTTGWVITGNTMLGGLYVINANDCVVTGNYMDGTGYNVTDAIVKAWYGSNRIVFTNNTVVGGKDLLSLAAVGGLRPIDWTIKGNLLRCTSGNPIYLAGCGPVTVEGNIIVGSNTTGEDQAGVYVFVTAVMEAVSITGNAIRDCGYGVYAATYLTNNIEILQVSGNTVTNLQGSPVADYGIRLAGTAAQFLSTTVSGNDIGTEYTNKVALNSTVTKLSGNGGGAGSIAFFTGTGTPESQVTAPVGSLYVANNGSTSTTLYVKTSGTGNTGWTAK